MDRSFQTDSRDSNTRQTPAACDAGLYPLRIKVHHALYLTIKNRGAGSEMLPAGQLKAQGTCFACDPGMVREKVNGQNCERRTRRHSDDYDYEHDHGSE